VGNGRTQRSQEAGGAPSSGIITYRGIRGLKHRNDRLHRSTTTPMVLDRPPGQADGERLPPQQNVVRQCPSSSDQRRPVHSPPSRRSSSADRLAASTSTPRTLFETLYHDKVHAVMLAVRVIAKINSHKKSCVSVKSWS